MSVAAGVGLAGEGYTVIDMTNLQPDFTDTGFLGHFEELRKRIFFVLLIIIAGIIVGWLLYEPAYRVLSASVLAGVKARGGIVFTSAPAEAFMTRMQLSCILGLIIASPAILWQLWLFIRPGLHRHERRAVGMLAPAMCCLFMMGAGIAYMMLPQVMTFFLGFVPAGVSPNISFQQSVELPEKLLLAFGLAFQLPIVLLGLVWLRVITPQVLLAQWRTAMVVIAILAGVITPTTDPLSWSLMMLPLTMLYFGTILVSSILIKSPHAKDAGGEAT